MTLKFWAVVLVAAQLLLALALAGRVMDLEIRVLDDEFLPRSSEVLAVDTEREVRFGSDERFLIAFENAGAVVDQPLWLSEYRAFRDQLLFNRNFGNLLLDRVDRARLGGGSGPGDGALLQPPDTAWIRAARAHSRFFSELSISRSGHAGFLETPALSAGGVRTLTDRLDEAFERFQKEVPGEHRVRLLGRQVVLNGLGEAIFEDLRRLLPWAFALLFVAIALLFRSPVLAALALLEVGLAVVCTLGIQQWLGHDVSLMTALVPVLVTALGVADEVHLFGEFFRQQAVAPRADRSSWVLQAVRQVAFPVTATTLTTVIGLSSFFFTDVPALRVFGLIAGVGAALSWFFTLSFVPAMLLWLPVGKGPRWARDDRSLRMPPGFRIAVPVGVALLMLWGLPRLVVDDGWTRNFSPNHPIVRDVEWFQRESTGLYTFDLLLERSDGRSWTEPRGLRELDGFRQSVVASPAISTGFSLADLVRDRGWELAGIGSERPAERPAVPDDQATVERWLDTYRLFNEEVFVRSFLTADGRSTRVILFSTGDDYATTTRARRVIDRELRRFAEERAWRGRVGGSAERGRTLIDAVVETQGTSVAAALVLALAALGFSSRSWRRSVLCVGATLFALVAALAVAGTAGWSLGVASSCFLALGFGVGLDYVIHLAFGRQMGSLGPIRFRVAANVALVCAGFSVLLLSSNPTIWKLGALLIVSMVTSGVIALVTFGGSE